MKSCLFLKIFICFFISRFCSMIFSLSAWSFFVSFFLCSIFIIRFLFVSSSFWIFFCKFNFSSFRSRIPSSSCFFSCSIFYSLFFPLSIWFWLICCIFKFLSFSFLSVCISIVRSKISFSFVFLIVFDSLICWLIFSIVSWSIWIFCWFSWSLSFWSLMIFLICSSSLRRFVLCCSSSCVYLMAFSTPIESIMIASLSSLHCLRYFSSLSCDAFRAACSFWYSFRNFSRL